MCTLTVQGPTLTFLMTMIPLGYATVRQQTATFRHQSVAVTSLTRILNVVWTSDDDASAGLRNSSALEGSYGVIDSNVEYGLDVQCIMA